MPEELQNLLDRIQKDGVEKADAEAAEIVSQAKAKAESILKDAEAKAEKAVQRGERDAQVFAERGEQALRQAARDIVIFVGQSVQRIFDGLVAERVDSALKGDLIKELVGRLANAYVEGRLGTDAMELVVGPEDEEAIGAFIGAEFAAAVKKGLEVRSERGLAAGFKVAFKGRDVYHDFSSEAISESMAQLLRPKLAELVRGMPNAECGTRSAE